MSTDDPSDLSLLSKEARAALDIMIESGADPSLRIYLTGAIGSGGAAVERRSSAVRRQRDVPATWTQIHVLDRMEEAYSVLSSLPMKTRPKVYGNNMPMVVKESRLSLLDQVLMMQSGELEELHDDRNRVRLAPTSAQITRMDEALRWPFEHLRDEPELARAISLRAMWAAMNVDIRKRCERRGIDHREFNANWQAAVAKITGALIARRIPVR